MQSFRQYRNIRRAVRRQLNCDTEKQELRPDQVQGVNAFVSSGISVTPDSLGSSSSEVNIAAPVITQQSIPQNLARSLTGIHVRDRTTNEGTGKVFVVGWEREEDPANPRNWSTAYRILVTLIVASISFVVGAASSTDTAILPQAAAEFGVSDVVESLVIGLYLIGFAVGALFAGAFSETFGRNAVYISTMILFMIFVMASALAPNIGAQLAFRFLAGVFGATPLTCAGGSISDMWPSLEKTYSFPIFAIAGFGGPVLGPVMGSYIINIGSWRWAEWIILICSGLVLGIIVLFQPETFPPLLLEWRASNLRSETGQDRYRSEMEINYTPLLRRLNLALTRAVFLSLEPIVLLMTLYLTVLYIVLFTFLDGYPYIFQVVYDTSQGLTNIIFTGIFVGILLAGLALPWMYKMTKDKLSNDTFVPEVRLWYAMIGAPAIPISLFWMGWTDYAYISIWSPIMASVLFGYGTICIFISAYTYVIDSYEIYAASALTFVTFTRYLVAGGMTVVGVPLYENLGPHWALTLMGCISVLMTPIPYVFYKYGHKIRQRSKYAVSWKD